MQEKKVMEHILGGGKRTHVKVKEEGIQLPLHRREGRKRKERKRRDLEVELKEIR